VARALAHAVIADLREAKRALRQRVLAERDALALEQRARASRAICDRILASTEFQRATAILAYMGFGSELDTTALTSHTLAAGKALILPRVDRVLRRLTLYRVPDLEQALGVGTWGIREPDPRRCAPADPRDVDFALIPGVAFTRAGDRLGYGAGYYDRLIPTLTGHPLLVAGAFAVQVRDLVPVGPADIPVDRIVTEGETWACSAPDQRH